MISAPPPPNESERLHSLHTLDILDTSTDPTLDALVRTAARMLGCPIALVSLVDADRQWFKAVVGLQAKETPRDVAFCAHAILGHEALVVPDTAHDPRFADNPLVTGTPRVAFYAGVPLFVDAHALGTLCVIDHRPRELAPEQVDTLRDLAKAVEHWLESRRAHLRLLDSERQFRLMAEQTPAIVYRAALDKESSTLYVSPRVHELGYSPEEWIAQPSAWSDILHPDDRERVLDALAVALQAGDTVQLQYRLRDAQGRWRHYEDVAQRIRPPGSDSAVLQGVMVDVTDKVEASLADPAAEQERKRQEAQLRRLSAAVQQAAEAILVTDLQGTIEYVNRAACDSSGYTESELVGQHTRLFKSGNTPAQAYADLWTALSAGGKWRGFLFNRRKDGSEYVEFATITPVRNSRSEVTSYLAVKEDVTEKRRMHDELERYRHHLDELVAARTTQLEHARQAAESANTAKSAFLATMSHEIRTPLNGVIGLTEVLRHSELTPEQQELAGTIAESANALLRVLDDVLDFSKIEAGRLQLEHRPFDLFKVVEGSCDTFQAMASGRGVELRCFVDPALAPAHLGDAFRVGQILTNLIGNAIKFSAGPERAGLVAVRATPAAGGGVQMEVRDNGIGMDEQVRSRLFQPFVQGESNTTRKYGGTGLGLVIVQGLAQAMAGRIECQSEPGMGSVFRVTLPALTKTPATEDGTRLPLQGLSCHLLPAADMPSTDWASYLQAAGATVRVWTHMPVRADLADAQQGEPVLLVDASLMGSTLPAGVPTVVLQPGHRRTPNRRQDGLVALDTVGLHRASLIDAVALAAQRLLGPSDTRQTALRQQIPAGADPAMALGQVILVAEDNEVNRAVIEHQLRLIGLACEVVENGALALQRLQAAPGRYGLVLTDLHMPLMDGYQLTAAIRAAEAGTRHVPVIALTANALRDESQRCLAAGMDACLTKPVPVDLLRETLAQWLPPADAATPHHTPAPLPPQAGQPANLEFDATALQWLVERNPQKVADLLAQYLHTAQQAMAELAEAMARDDLPAAGGTGHRLKSSSRSVGAMQLADQFELLERACKAGDATAARSMASRLPEALHRLRAALLTTDRLPES